MEQHIDELVSEQAPEPLVHRGLGREQAPPEPAATDTAAALPIAGECSARWFEDERAERRQVE